MSFVPNAINLLILLYMVIIHSVHSTVNTNNKGKMLEPDIYGKILLSDTFVDMQTIPRSSISFRSLSILDCDTLKWDQSKPIFMEHLEEFQVRSTTINPHSLTFSDKLDSLTLRDITLINGTVYDLLRTATNLKNLHLGQMKQVDVSELVRGFSSTFATLESLTIEAVEFVNGTLYDILRVATRLNKLQIEHMETTIDISKILTRTNTLAFLETLVSLTVTHTKVVNGVLSNMLESIPNLHTLEFERTGQLAVSNLTEFTSKYQNQKLVSLSLTRLKFTKGNLYDVLGMTPNLKNLVIDGLGDVDISKLIQKSFTHNLVSIKMSYTKFMNGNLKDLLNSMSNLEKLDLSDLEKVDLESLNFNDNLTSLTMWSTELVSRPLHELLVTATNLQALDLERMGTIDISKLPLKSLTEVSIVVSTVTFSTPFVFHNLLSLNFECEGINSTFFEDFVHRFPKVEDLETGTGFVVPPNTLLSMLRSPAMKNMTFAFDFDPQILTYDFGEAMKIMVEAGLTVRPLVDPVPLKEKVRYVTFHKHRGAFRVVNSQEQTWLFNYIYTDAKSDETKKFVYIYFLCFGVLICAGVLGNSLSAYLLLKSRMRNCAGNILLSLTVFDSAVILTYLASSFFNAQIFYKTFVKTEEKLRWYEVESRVWMSQQSDVQSFLIYPLNKTAYTASVYTTILISLERFIAVCYPLRAKLILSPMNSKLGMLGVLLFSVLLNLPRWVESYEWNWYSESSPYWNDYYRPTLMRMETYKLIYHGWLWVSLMYILPFVLIGYLNFKILQQIKKSKLIRESLQSSNTNTEQDTELRSITKMLLCVVTVFVACNACHIAIVFYFLLSYGQIELSTIEAVACLPIVINCSVNFIIYIMLGKTMRAQFLKLLPKTLCFCFTVNRSSGSVNQALN